LTGLSASRVRSVHEELDSLTTQILDPRGALECSAAPLDHRAGRRARTGPVV